MTMRIYYSKDGIFLDIDYKDSRQIKPLDRKKVWDIGVDGSSTSFGFAIRDVDKTETHLITLIRDDFSGPSEFREVMFPWLADFLVGLRIRTATYERTPEGYRPPTSHAERVMRDTEKAVKEFLHSSGYFLLEAKNYIFDVFPNAWKEFNIPKSVSNRGKVNKHLNALGVLQSAGMESTRWLKPYLNSGLKHDFDSFEALGLLRYGSEYLLTDEGKVRVYKNYSRIGSTLVLIKRFDSENLQEEVDFISSFGGRKIPRVCDFNYKQSLPQNLLGLHDTVFNNILIAKSTNDFSIYIDFLMEFDIVDNRDYLILSARTSKVDTLESECLKAGFKITYL